MLLQRAFVLGVSPRAVLAVAALALSVAYALTAAGAISTLDPQAATLADAEANPGVALYRLEPGAADPFAPFGVAEAPSTALLVDWTVVDGVRVSTLRLAPGADPSSFPDLPPLDQVLFGLHVDQPTARGVLDELGLEAPRNARALSFAPSDALVVPAASYDAAHPERAGFARLAFVPGAPAPPAGFTTTPWQGLAGFFEKGAAQLTTSLVAVIAASGLVAALLASGLLYLEVLARRRDLSTVAALAGVRTARRLVVARTVVLVAAGLLVGLAAAFVALRVGSAAIGTRLTVPVPVWLATGLGVALGATLFGSIAALSALRRHGLSMEGSQAVPVRRFPGPVRFLLVSPRVFAGVFAATLVTSAVLLTLTATTAVPYTLFQATTEGDETYLSGGGGNVLRGNVDRFLGEHAHLLPGVVRALPETYAPTVLDQGGKTRAIMVRGTDHGLWRAFEPVALREGAWPDAPGEATIGVRAARTHSVSVGDVLVVPASYARGVEAVHVVGVHAGAGLWDDQLVPDLGTAARLAGIAPDRVTGVRMQLEGAVDSWELVAPDGVETSSVRLEPTNPVPLTPFKVHVTLVNFDAIAADHPLAVRVNGVLAWSETLHLEARSVTTHTVALTAPLADVVRVEVNPTQDAATQPGTLVLTVPERATPGEAFLVEVAHRDGPPVEGADVLADGVVVATTDETGSARVTLADARLATISAVRGTDAAGALLRVAPPGWDDEVRLVAERIHAHAPSAAGESQFTIRLEATVANLGGMPHDGPVVFAVGEHTANATASVASGARASVQTTMRLPYGAHTVEVAGAEHALTVRAPGAPGSGGTGGDEEPRARTIEEVIAAKRAARDATAPRAGDPGDSFLERVFSDLESAAVLVVLATVLHGGALIWVSMLRDVREREAVPTLLRQLGASQDQVRTRTVRDALLSATGPVFLGLAAAWILLAVARILGQPAAFGHTLPVEDAPGFLVRTGAALLFVAVLAALYGTQTSRTARSRHASRSSLVELAEGVPAEEGTFHAGPVPAVIVRNRSEPGGRE